MPEPPLRVLKLALLLPPPLLPRLAAASPAALDASTASAAAAAAASTAADGRGCLTGILGLLLAAADEENLHACITSPCKEALPEQNQTIIEHADTLPSYRCNFQQSRSDCWWDGGAEGTTSISAATALHGISNVSMVPFAF